MAQKRKALSKRQRFEVFKRDSFTCQYCGQSAPDVILNADHVIPVAKGGTNKLTNLVTSCFDCNSGKSDKLLDDDSAVKMQMNQLKANQERVEQIKMIADWAKSQSMKPEIDQINKLMDDLSGTYLTDHGERKMREKIRKYGFKEVIESIYESWDKYQEKYIEKLDTVLRYRSSSEEDKHWMYSVGILRNRVSYYDKHKSAMMLSKAKENGLTKDDFRQIVLTVSNWTEYRSIMEEYDFG